MLLRMRLDRRLGSLFPLGRGLNLNWPLAKHLLYTLSPGSGAEPIRVLDIPVEKATFPRTGG